MTTLNNIFIFVIPKSDRSGNLEDYRPISLCNFIYKMIAKVITKRIGGILSSLISHEQFGFMARRHIHDVVGIAQEFMHTVKVNTE